MTDEPVTNMAGRAGLAFVHAPLAVYGLRFTDGIGKGIKDPPKDVLVANAAESTSRGRSFGVARMLDTFGSALGPLILYARGEEHTPTAARSSDGRQAPL